MKIVLGVIAVAAALVFAFMQGRADSRGASAPAKPVLDSRDYRLGKNVGSNLSAYMPSGMTGRQACSDLRDSQYVVDRMGIPRMGNQATRDLLATSDGFAGCLAGFKAG